MLALSFKIQKYSTKFHFTIYGKTFCDAVCLAKMNTAQTQQQVLYYMVLIFSHSMILNWALSVVSNQSLQGRGFILHN